MQMDKETIQMNMRGLDTAKKIMEAMSDQNISTGDVAMGCLYVIRFYTKTDPMVLLTARRALSLMTIFEEQNDEPKNP